MKGVTSAMFRDLPVARLSAALEGTKFSSAAATETFSLVLVATGPRPDKALDAVDFDTPANAATSESVVMLITVEDAFRLVKSLFFVREVLAVRGAPAQ